HLSILHDTSMIQAVPSSKGDSQVSNSILLPNAALTGKLIAKRIIYPSAALCYALQWNTL
ncbi:hypothetical protein, partial [Shewanella chilikensis]|uniref:hypothetical protein n=1 Tax=Shewanella chilikensis TaxID=558541 RepID=UPI00399B2B86